MPARDMTDDELIEQLRHHFDRSRLPGGFDNGSTTAEVNEALDRWELAKMGVLDRGESAALANLRAAPPQAPARLRRAVRRVRGLWSD